jgi:hypothetical protein
MVLSVQALSGLVNGENQFAVLDPLSGLRIGGGICHNGLGWQSRFSLRFVIGRLLGWRARRDDDSETDKAQDLS